MSSAKLSCFTIPCQDDELFKWTVDSDGRFVVEKLQQKRKIKKGHIVSVFNGGSVAEEHKGNPRAMHWAPNKSLSVHLLGNDESVSPPCKMQSFCKPDDTIEGKGKLESKARSTLWWIPSKEHERLFDAAKLDASLLNFSFVPWPQQECCILDYTGMYATTCNDQIAIFYQ